MATAATKCTAEGCTRDATTWLRFAGMGDLLHVHVCPQDEAVDREWADVIESGPLPCPDRLHCGPPLLTTTPPLLEG